MSNGNIIDSIKGYGNLVIPDLKVKDLYVKYYFDVTSYLYDPDKCGPVNTTNSSFKTVDP